MQRSGTLGDQWEPKSPMNVSSALNGLSPLPTKEFLRDFQMYAPANFTVNNSLSAEPGDGKLMSRNYQMVNPVDFYENKVRPAEKDRRYQKNHDELLALDISS